ncbi:MAG: hypothetical protein V4696_02730 [Pseudomonadota bacterium]
MLAGFIFACGSAGTAWALPRPMTLAPVFDNTISSAVKPAKDSIACPVRIIALGDLRRSPEMVGVHDRRQILAPQDRAAWLRSIVTALNTRGISVSFEGDAAAPDASTAKVDLTTAWITDTKVNISASAVFRMQVTNAGGASFDRSYRGGNSRMTYWTNGRPVLQQAIDVAFARALDAMAVDLLTSCKAPA